MFTPKASSEQKWVKKTQEREIGDAVTVHRTTMECAEKQLFCHWKHRSTISSIVLRWNVDNSTGTDQFHSKNPHFSPYLTQIRLKRLY